MARLHEWQAEVNKLAPWVAEQKYWAIVRLLDWDFFSEQFGDSGLSIIKNLCQARAGLNRLGKEKE